ncbi:hypothetical protein IG631_24032 [Alternaria alternata]|nr:hypothetical protein IG631_24032 [Alternaria alternata]
MRLVSSVEAYNARGKQFLERLTSSKPPASPKLSFPSGHVGYTIDRWPSIEHIRQKNVASSRLLIPAKHGVDRMLKLDMICLVDAARIHPEVPQAVPLGLLCAEADLVEARLVTSKTSFKLVEGDFLTRQPGVREYSVGGHVVGAYQVLGERDRAVVLYLEQSHVVKEELRSLPASGWTAWKRGSLSSC